MSVPPAPHALPTWDDAQRPAIVPAGPLGRPGPDGVRSLQHLRAIHDQYRTALAQVGDLVDRLRLGQAGLGEVRAALHGVGLTEAYQLLGSWCGQLCRMVGAHHSIEDAHLYPGLRAADLALGATLDRLDHEHLVVHEVLDELDRRVVAAAGLEPAVGGRAVAEAFVHLRGLLESHFTYEEEAVGAALGDHGVWG